MSQKSVAVDFDGTLVENCWPKCGDWLPGAVDFLKALQKRGFKVVIHSCRAVYLSGQTEIREMLRDAGLRDVEIWNEPGKPIAAAYVDDRGIHFDGDYSAAMRAVLELA